MGATAGAAAEVGPPEQRHTPLAGDGFQVEGTPSTQEVVLRVGNTSDVKQLASSISFALQDSKRVVLRAVGANAVNQMAKGCAIARTYVASRGVDLSVRPGFVTVEMPDLQDRSKMVEQTAIIFVVKVD